ncbi:MAG: hypothetical protein ACRC9R_08565 [Enterovibrio sp.]
MKKNVMLPIAATFIAAAFLPTAFAYSDAIKQTELLFSYTNMSNELAFVAIKGGRSPDEYVAINDVGWVAPQASGNVTNDSPWIMEQQINKNSVVSLAFLIRNNEVITCKKDFYLDHPIDITLKVDEDGIFECAVTDQSTSTPNPNPNEPGLTFRFKEVSSHKVSRYALFFYEYAEKKWKNLTRSVNIHDGNSGSQQNRSKWFEVINLRPRDINTALTANSTIRLAVREEYNNGQDEEYNNQLPMWICGDVKFSGRYEFVFYEEGQSVFSGCSSNT